MSLLDGLPSGLSPVASIISLLSFPYIGDILSLCRRHITGSIDDAPGPSSPASSHRHQQHGGIVTAVLTPLSSVVIHARRPPLVEEGQLRDEAEQQAHEVDHEVRSIVCRVETGQDEPGGCGEAR